MQIFSLPGYRYFAQIKQFFIQSFPQYISIQLHCLRWSEILSFLKNYQLFWILVIIKSENYYLYLRVKAVNKMLRRQVDGLQGKKNPFCDLDQGGAVMAYYIWIDGSGQNMRFAVLYVQFGPDILYHMTSLIQVRVTK